MCGSVAPMVTLPMKNGSGDSEGTTIQIPSVPLPTANPLMSSGQYNQAAGQFTGAPPNFPTQQLPNTPMSGQQNSALASQLMGLTNAANQRGALDFSRNYSAQNAQFLPQAQQAQANAAHAGIGYMMNQQQDNFNRFGQQRNLLLDALQGQGALGGFLA